MTQLEAIRSCPDYTSPDVPDVVQRWLAATLVKARYARLGQAGHSSQARITLAQVFTDIETSASVPGFRRLDGDMDEEPEGPEPEGAGDFPQPGRTGFVGYLLSLSPRPVEFQHRRRSCGHHHLAIGGPGQGKSTTGQFLAQIHRASLLGPVRAQLDEEACETLDEITGAVAGDELSWPARTCIPARLPLGELAAWMVRKSVKPERAVLAYLCEHIGKLGGAPPLAEQDLRALMQQAPWLLIFDGLDEVPVSGGKQLVVEAISAARRLLAELATPCLIVATTRPQGYQRELGRVFLHHQLQPMSAEYALAYSRKLVAHRYPAHRQELILQRLEQACAEAATARLMQSPLQVTIMAALVDRIGRPPHQRWLLFREYYRVIYEREMERPNSPASQLLRDQRAHIDSIHEHVGLLLQVESERQGGTDALLSEAQLQQLVEERLRNEGFAATERARLAAEMVRVATDRLVFLVSPREGYIGFELRSLQEFMAAQALMQGREAHVEARLRAIAPLAFWRNVFLFAAGHIATDRRPLRDLLVHELLDELRQTGHPAIDESGAVAAELALRLLEDGSWDDSPGHLRVLGRHALGLLVQNRHAERLALLEQPVMKEMIRAALEAEAAGGAPGIGVWLVAWICADAGAKWARAWVEQRWQTDLEVMHFALQVAFSMEEVAGEWLSNWVVDRISQLSPWKILRLEGALRAHRGITGPARQRLDDICEALRNLYDGLTDSELGNVFVTVVVDAPALRAHLTASADSQWARLPDRLHWLEELPNESHMWQLWIAARRFALQPTPTTLADELQRLTRFAELDRESLPLWHIPWPLATCLARAHNPADLRVFAQAVRTGSMGTEAEWLRAEQLWREQGIILSKLVEQVSALSTEGPDIACIRFTTCLTSSHDDRVSTWLAVQRARQLSRERGVASQLDTLACEFLTRLWTSNLGVVIPSAVWQEHLPTCSESLFLDASVLAAMVMSASHDQDWLGVLDQLALRSQYIQTPPSYDAEYLPFLRALLSLFLAHPHRRGLQRLVDLVFVYDFKHLRTLLPMTSARVDNQDAHPLITILRILWESWNSARIEAWLATVDQAPFLPLQKVIEALFEKQPEHLALLESWHSHARPQDRQILELHIQRLWTACKSGLAQAERWHQLALPAPDLTALLDEAPPDAPDASPDAPASDRDAATLAGTFIDHIAIEHVRAFESLTLDLPAPTARDAGRWIVLVGENGTGKSTLLRALALALVDPGVAAGLVAGSMAPMVRSQFDAAEIRARIRGATFTARLRVEAGREELVRPRDPQGPDRPLLFAYGCGRGSAIGGPDREIVYTDMARVGTLFDESEGLLSAETWLKLVHLGALEEGGALKERRDLLCATLAGLLPGVETLDIDRKGVWLTGTVGERVPLTALSDGYITSIGWMTDLMARWLHRAELQGLDVPPDFNRHMQGIVLVDELDLHLHPRWQCRVISDLRVAFPRLSFVVTTHNPLTLQGARTGEIFVVRRTPDGSAIEVVPCPPLDGLRADQVLTGEWFGLASTLDPESLQLLAEHRALLRQRIPADDPRRVQLEDTLRQRLGRFSETPLEQLAHEVAAEVVEENYQRRPPAERLEIRQKFKQMLRQHHAQGQPSKQPSGDTAKD